MALKLYDAGFTLTETLYLISNDNPGNSAHVYLDDSRALLRRFQRSRMQVCSCQQRRGPEHPVQQRPGATVEGNPNRASGSDCDGCGSNDGHGDGIEGGKAMDDEQAELCTLCRRNCDYSSARVVEEERKHKTKLASSSHPEPRKLAASSR